MNIRLLRKLRALLSRRATEQHMSAVLQAHIEMLMDRHIAAGMSPADARNAALREFGGVEQTKERCRDERTFTWLEIFWRDFRSPARGLPALRAARVDPVITLRAE